MDASAHLRVLVVDDSVLYRKIISSVLTAVPDVEVVGVAANGRLALQQIEILRPDLVTLDLEMPELDGLQVLERIRDLPTPPASIMLSALTSRSAEATVAALHLGAFEFVLKPAGSDMNANAEKLKAALLARVDAFRTSRAKQHALRPNAPPAPRACSTHTAPAAAPPEHAVLSGARLQPRVVLIGVSTGGPAALNQVIPRLPADFPLPILVVQHMPPLFTQSLAKDLDDRAAVKVCEGRHGQVVLPGHVIIAPGGRQLRLDPAGTPIRIVLTDDPPENSCRPAVDYLFRSAAQVYGGACLGVILTGMGNDGTQGSRIVRQLGGSVIAQDEHTCVVYGMPRSVAEQGLADAVLPLQRISEEIMRRVGAGEVVCN